MAPRKLRKADLVRLAVAHARGPREVERADDGTKVRCAWRSCENIVDRSKPRAKHAVYCSPKCRKLAFDERQLQAARLRATS